MAVRNHFEANQHNDAKACCANCRHCPCTRDPSRYQTAASGRSSGGARIHLNHSPGCGGGAGKRSANRPLVCSNLSLFLLSLPRHLAAALGAAGQPPTGRVALQQKRCSSVPTAARQSWHLASVRFHWATFTLRACGHWPPEAAETIPALAALSHTTSSTTAFLERRLLARVLAKSTTTVPWAQEGAPTSQLSGIKAGCVLPRRAKRHRRTDARTSQRMRAGESSRKFQE